MMSELGPLQPLPEILRHPANGGAGQTSSTPMIGHALAATIIDPTSTNPPSGQDTSALPPLPPPTPVKTDKPRPHVCGTCARSFARLEHLKRHERSHTKEKPFECPECTRCFARRDLLLRHQQKLHMTTTPSSRPRGRRESSSGTGVSGPGGRVRKNSIANGPAGIPGASGHSTVRPRANTISHVDGTTMGMIAAANATAVRRSNAAPGHSHHASLTGFPGPGGYEFRGMSTSLGQHGNSHGLPKLETQGLANMDLGGGLRTAPVYGNFQPNLEFDGLLFGGTINPAQLHFNNSPHTMPIGTPTSPFHHGFPNMSADPTLMEDEDTLDWMTGFESQMSFAGAHDQAVEESSPSAISTTSQSGISEVMLDGSNVPAPTNHASDAVWPQHILMQPPNQITPTHFSLDVSEHTFGLISPPGTVSPKSLHAQNGNADPYFSTPPPLTSSTHALPSHQVFHPPMIINPGTPTTPSASISGSARQSSITSVSTESITDATRQALLSSLSQPSHFSHTQRKRSMSSGAVPPPPGFATSSFKIGASLPSTRDLQRYVAAYIQYFHPHLPFLHIGTLTFDSPALTHGSLHSGPSLGGLHSALAGGAGCLILAMAAIGALYEFEPGPSKELFESAKKMIQLYLEERRMADLTAGMNGVRAGSTHAAQNTPLWLVQAMLLNVVYGINCGDKTSADIASTHCAALVSLARAAELTQSTPVASFPSHPSVLGNPMFSQYAGPEDIHMGDEGNTPSEAWNLGQESEMPSDQTEWYSWKVAEERKRTLYAVFILSSLLVAAYNHAPALTNSEILLDLPCDEHLWAAENVHMWSALGGARVAEHKAVTFCAALGDLLSASQRPSPHHSSRDPVPHAFGSGPQFQNIPESELKPSTFGCLVLINALHNYIWETRQRHHSRQWTSQETEAMHSHIEPALKAWQAAWASDPHHSPERPNPFGRSPLSADSIPLLDLAYVRLFVNLGRSKEAFWARDHDGMAHELARGSEIVQHAAQTPPTFHANGTPTDRHGADQGSLIQPGRAPGQYSKRERHLRRAAFYAADSLSMSDKLGVTFADFNSRELPLQSAMCAFDCAQVLAEWVSTVQERVGRYLGVLGRDEIDCGQVPSIMLLEDEDFKLLEKIAEVINSVEMKMTFDPQRMHAAGGLGGITDQMPAGYGSKVLTVTAYMLNKAAVWPVTNLMAQALEVHAGHMAVRAENSLLQHD